jgi:hypothetical protein
VDEAFKAVIEACTTFAKIGAPAEDKEQAKICIAEMAQSAVEMLDATIAQLVSRSQAPLPGSAAIGSRMRSTLQQHVRQLRDQREKLVSVRFVACAEALAEDLKLEVEGAVALAEGVMSLKLDAVNTELKPDDSEYIGYWTARNEEGKKQRTQLDRAVAALASAKTNVHKGLTSAKTQKGTGSNLKALTAALEGHLNKLQQIGTKLTASTKSAQHDRDRAASIIGQFKVQAEKEVNVILAPLLKAETEQACRDLAAEAEAAVAKHSESRSISDSVAEALRSTVNTKVSARVAVLAEAAAKREKAEKEKAEREAALQRLYDTYGRGSNIQADGVVAMGKKEFHVDVDLADAEKVVKQIEVEKGAGIPAARVAQLQSQLKVRADIVMQKLRKEKEAEERRQQEAALQTILDGAQAAVEKSAEIAEEVEKASVALRKALASSEGALPEIAALSAHFPSATEVCAATVDQCRSAGSQNHPAPSIHATFRKDIMKSTASADSAKARVAACLKQLDAARKSMVASGDAACQRINKAKGAQLESELEKAPALIDRVAAVAADVEGGEAKLAALRESVQTGHLRSAALTLRTKAAASGKDWDVFVAEGDDEKQTQDGFTKWCIAQGVSEATAGVVFGLLQVDGKVTSMERLSRSTFRVVKEVTVTSGFEVKGSTKVAKLAPGDVFEAEGGAKETAAGKLQRVKGKIVKAKAEDTVGRTGWITLVGNEGGKFLVEVE